MGTILCDEQVAFMALTMEHPRGRREVITCTIESPRNGDGRGSSLSLSFSLFLKNKARLASGSEHLNRSGYHIVSATKDSE